MEKFGRVSQRTDYRELTPSIVRKEFSPINGWSWVFLKKMTLARMAFQADNELAGKVSSKLSNNLYAGHEELGKYRPQSAYFLLDNGKVKIDLCVKQADGTIKHELMRAENSEYADPTFFNNPDKVLLSGHMGKLNLPIFGEIDVALFDAFSSKNALSPQNKQFPIIATLYAHGIIPVDADGIPIQLEPRAKEAVLFERDKVA